MPRAPRPQRRSGAELGPPNPQTAPQQILELPEEALFVLKDFGCYLNSRTFTYFDIVIAGSARSATSWPTPAGR
jgi:hypothetical protein